MKVLAVNINGVMTYCTAPPELRGIGRCNHVAHQNEGESTEEFVERISNLQETLANEEKETFIPYEGTEIQTQPYRMTEEEREKLIKIENRMQLDQNIEGGYIELNEPLWNDMDKNYFSEMSGIHTKNINQILKGDSYIVLSSENKKYPIGKVLSLDIGEELLKNDNLDFELGTGVEDFNRFAKDIYNWEATRYIYVLPYYMRRGVGKDLGNEEEDDSEEISSEITLAYKYLLRNHKDPNKQQLAYNSLLNNSAMSEDTARYTNGYKNKGLADQFVGKGGVFRACLSGSSIPYSARGVITPEVMPYGEIKIPPSIAIDIFKPTLLEQFAYEGASVEEIDAYFREFRKPQTEIPEELRLDLERRVYGKRVIMNRQPSLHTSSLQSFRPRVSSDATIKIHPLYCDSYGADFDGDTVTVYGINLESIIPTVDRSIGAHNEINTHKPRSVETCAIMPSKDALWGLLNILDKRSN